MKYYLAPLEGITTTVFRNAYHAHFRPMDKYFTPFLVPHSKKGFSTREKREVDPENNRGLYLVPQIMSNQAKDCLQTIGKLEAYGYREINLNMGCPSKTVVSKGRGSGFLAYPEDLDAFLEEVFEGLPRHMKLSVKTRLGKEAPEEFYRILDIYNQYPLEELIIHPRVQTDFYKNTPDFSMFAYGMENSACPVCYNGDIFSAGDYDRVRERFPQTDLFMLGRGILENPFLIREISRDPEAGKDMAVFWAFHDDVYQGYQELSMGNKNVLFKMKELWCYMGKLFPGREKTLKKIRKAESPRSYEAALAELR